MRQCQLQTTDRPGVLVCRRCGHQCASDDPPHKTHRACCRRGLGTLIQQALSAVGIPACGGCEQRADWLDAHVPLP